MHNVCDKDNLDSLPTGIYEIPGEPAVLINGLPPVSATDDINTENGNADSCPIVSDTDLTKNQGLGVLIVGREVQKVFGKQLYSGIVSEFDQEYGWYRVEYEDGDTEDLEWDELVKVLQPLDISVPLKAISTKVLGKKYKSIMKSAKSRSRTKRGDEANSDAGGALKKRRDT